MESFGTVRGYATLLVVGKGHKPTCAPVPIPALGPVQAVIDGRTAGPLLRTRSGAGMDRRSVHRYVAAIARAAGISRPIGPHALRRTVGPVGLNQASRCVMSSGFYGTPARRPPSAATTSPAKRWSVTPPTRSPASSLAGPADRCLQAAHSRTPTRRSSYGWTGGGVCPFAYLRRSHQRTGRAARPQPTNMINAQTQPPSR